MNYSGSLRQHHPIFITCQLFFKRYNPTLVAWSSSCIWNAGFLYFRKEEKETEKWWHLTSDPHWSSTILAHLKRTPNDNNSCRYLFLKQTTAGKVLRAYLISTSMHTHTVHLKFFSHLFVFWCQPASLSNQWLLAHLKCTHLTRMWVAFPFPPLPLVYPNNTASCISKRERERERERPRLHMTSVLYWSKARGKHNSTFVLRSIRAPMSSHSQQIVYACDGVTSKHSSGASDKLRIALALWGSVDFFFNYIFFICIFRDLNLSVDWIIIFHAVKLNIRGYLLLSIFGWLSWGKCGVAFFLFWVFIFWWYSPVGNASFSSFLDLLSGRRNWK